ncbi:hypothetical protein [Saccharothrix xinjiangensis]|uniref:Tail assembly chaperone n=1 Tax=Saccharothrix xinjiangensis TaxID=204798 RepID=A0ABV9XTE5_9PSEU
MVATTTKRAPRRAPAAKPRKAPAKASPKTAALTAVGDFEPIEIVTPETPVEQELIHLFSIDGVAYHVPANPPPAIALRFVRTAWQAGTELALAELLERMLGPEAYDALAECDAMTPEQLRSIMQHLQRLSMGTLDGPKGGSTRSA